MVTATEPDLYYDPYDFEIDADPYPLWRRLRDEAPLYYNEKYDFFALTRFANLMQTIRRLSNLNWQLNLIQNTPELGQD